MESRPPQPVRDPELEKIENHDVPVITAGKVTGGKAMSVAESFAYLMMMNKKHGGGSKSNNYKEKKKADQRRHEKKTREFEKEMKIEMEAA